MLSYFFCEELLTLSEPDLIRDTSVRVADHLDASRVQA